MLLKYLLVNVDVFLIEKEYTVKSCQNYKKKAE
jgi:hypothetical protein